MYQLIIATKNRKKLKELKKLLKGAPLKIKGLNQLKIKIPNIKEDKNTFVGNAKKKALTISRLLKNALVLADDSGLVVKSLSGAPGINSARYAGAAQNDDKNIAKLLKRLQNKKDRSAYFISTAVLAKNNKIIGVAEGKAYGLLANERRGNSGFGYDPVFIPNGYRKTFAQMNPGFKNKISHRGKALRKAKIIVERYLQAHR